jgi:hypothetical protein
MDRRRHFSSSSTGTRKSTGSVASVLALVAVAVTGCRAPVDGERTGTTAAPIINGTVVPEADSGMVQVLPQVLPSGSTSWCSGALVTNRWLVTAKHCVRDYLSTPSALFAQMNGETRTVDVIQTHPILDAAMVHVTAGFTMNGMTAWWYRGFYTGTTASLVGQTLNCSGYGFNVLTDGALGTGDGILREGNMAVDHTINYTYNGGSIQDGLYVLLPNASGQIQAVHDSGSACLLNGLITGVQSGGDLGCPDSYPLDSNNQWCCVYGTWTDSGNWNRCNLAGPNPEVQPIMVDAYQTSAAAFRDWAYGVMGGQNDPANTLSLSPGNDPLEVTQGGGSIASLLMYGPWQTGDQGVGAVTTLLDNPIPGATLTFYPGTSLDGQGVVDVYVYAASSTPPGTYHVPIVVTDQQSHVEVPSSFAVEVFACVPQSAGTVCSQTANQCGSWSLGCGLTTDCGTCPSGDTCSFGYCCPDGYTYYDSSVGCVPTTCPAGQELCTAVGASCMTVEACDAAIAVQNRATCRKVGRFVECQ